jgi:hypothetical protein
MKTYIRPNRTVKTILDDSNIQYKDEKKFDKRIFVVKDDLDIIEDKLDNNDKFAEIIDATYLGIWNGLYIRDGELIEG